MNVNAQVVQSVLMVLVMLPAVGAVFSGRLLHGLFASLVVAAIGWLVLLPAVERNDIYAAIAAEGPEARFAVEVFRECRSPGLFQSNPVAQCEQMVIDLAGKRGDQMFAGKAETTAHQLATRIRSAS